VDSKCNAGHVVTKEHNFFCTPCNRQTYPKFVRIIHEGEDVSRKESILNNNTTSFYVPEKGKRKELFRAEALGHIIKNSCDRHLSTQADF
jgi:hypothetical protein